MEGLAFQADKVLLDTVFDGVVVVDLKTFRISLANNAAADILGLDDPDELVGVDPLSYIPREDRDSISTLLSGLASGNRRQQALEVRVLGKRGKEIWIMARGVKLASNGTSVLLASFRDITAQKLAEMALREAERKHLELLDISHEMILISQDWKVVFANRRLQEAMGLSREALAGMSILDLTHPDDRKAVTQRYQKMLDGESILSERAFKGIGKDGKTAWGIMRHVPFTWQGKPALMTLIQDVTDQRTAEEALRSGEERYRHLLENANESVAIIQDWKVAYVNRKFEEIIGIPRQSLAGLHILDLTHPDDRQAVSERYQKIMNGERYSSGAPLRGMDKDGKVRWAEGREIPFMWEGKPAVLSMMVDFTERKEAEEALQESERKYRLVAENASDVIWTTDMDFKVTYMSPSAARMLRCSMVEAMTLTVTDMLTPESMEWGMSLLQEQLAMEGQEGISPQREWNLDLQLRRRDGSTVWVEEKVNFIRDAKNQPMGIMGITRDISERKKAEKAVSDSEKKYRQLVETLHEGIWVIDRDANTTFVNPRMAEILGYTQDEMTGKPLLSFMDEQGVALAKQNLDRRQRGVKERHDFEFLRKDGTRVYASLETSPILDPDGQYAGAIAGVQDVTERKKAEEALHESEEKFRALVENSAAVVFSLNTQGIVTYISPAIERLSGFKADAVVGTSCIQYVVPEDLPGLMTSMERTLAGQLEPHEFRVKHKDGNIHHVLTSSRPITRDGELAGLIGVMVDVTDGKEAQEALRDSERRYRLLAENVQDVIYTTDMSLNISYVSPSITKLLGYRPEEVLQTGLDKLVTPASLEAGMTLAAERLAKQAAGGIGFGDKWTIELELMRKDGGTVWVEVTANFVRGQADQAAGLTGVVRDISDRRQSDEALRASEEKYRALYEDNPSMYFTVDPTGTVLSVNRFGCEQLGYSAEELLGQSVLKVFHDEDKAAAARSVTLCVENPGQVFDWELRKVHESGNVIWVKETARAVRGDDGKTVVFIVCEDISGRKRTEEALKDSEAKYRDLFEHTLLGMEVVDAETMKVVLANHSMARMSGFKSPEDMVGTVPLDYVLPEDLEWVAAELAKAMANPNMYEVATLRSRTADGRIMWVTGMATQFDYEGTPSVLISLVDVTAAKEADVKVAESEEKNRLLIENAAEGIAVVQDGLLKFVNPKCAEFTGRPPQELLSTRFLDIVHPEDRQMMADNYAKRLSGEESPNNYQFRIIDRSGNAKWLQINAVQFAWEGRPATLSMLNDVTERKEAEDALRDSEHRYRLIAENSSDVIWTMDMDLRMTYVSPSVEKLTGYSAEESISMRIGDGLTPASLETASYAFAKGQTDLERNGGRPTSPETLELEMKRKDGSTVWAEVQMSFMQDSRGRVVGIMGVARDIDERRRARKALEESEERFRALIEGARDAIAVIDSGGKVTYRSPSAEHITDGGAEHILTTSLQERLHPDDVAKATSILESLMNSPDGSVVDVELRYRCDDESWGTIEARGTNRFHDPKICGIVVNYRDITERRQAQEAFRESESRYRLLAENVSDVIWSLDLKSRQSFFSQSVVRLLGYTVEEAQSLKMNEVISPTSYPKAMMAFSKLSSKPDNGSDGRSSSMQLDIELMRKDGSLVWVDISVTFVRDTDGQPGELFGVIRDVTQRKKAEEALRTSEEYFRTLIENAWDAIVILDAQGTMLYESPSSARIMGYEPEEIVGRSLIEFVRPEDVAANVDMFKRFRTEPGSTVMMDAGFRHKDGHYIECEGTLQNLLHDPKINGIVANWRDVTDRRRAQEAILASEERFRNLVEATSDWVWETDPNGIYTFASSKACEVLGYEVSEIVGRSIYDFMPSRESNRFALTFKSHAEKREPFAFLETSRQRKDGKVIVMETSGVPFFAGDSSLLGYRGIGRDITKRKIIETELEKSVKKLEKTMESTIQAISYTMETRDPYTTGHQKRVTQLACAIAKEMGIASWQIDGIRVAGLLHDIGKIAVPTEILSKPGKLSDIEFSMIKSHPKVGFDILKNVEFEWPIARIVVQHHERLDGSGYPYGIRGRDILQESRVLAVADVVEAMSSHRPYRAALGIEKALAEVARGEGTLYDSDVVRACAKVINERGFKFES
jgi:PAS domain S-box-containing protein/putative nucleotidyltransferase with HDIG domain